MLMSGLKTGLPRREDRHLLTLRPHPVEGVEAGDDRHQKHDHQCCVLGPIGPAWTPQDPDDALPDQGQHRGREAAKKQGSEDRGQNVHQKASRMSRTAIIVLYVYFIISMDLLTY